MHRVADSMSVVLGCCSASLIRITEGVSCGCRRVQMNTQALWVHQQQQGCRHYLWLFLLLLQLTRLVLYWLMLRESMNRAVSELCLHSCHALLHLAVRCWCQRFAGSTAEWQHSLPAKTYAHSHPEQCLLSAVALRTCQHNYRRLLTAVAGSPMFQR